MGAESELRKAIEERVPTDLKDFLHEKGMEWKFVTPGAAHHNGCAESLIRLCSGSFGAPNRIIRGGKLTKSTSNWPWS